MEHHFDIDVACEVGIAPAVIYYNISWWCNHNRTNGVHCYDGLYWTFNSVKAYKELFPYMSDKQIRCALKTLEDKGYIKTGNYNKAAFDHTTWYADLRETRFATQGTSNCPTGQIELTERENGIAPQGNAIPNINTNTKLTDINTDSKHIESKRTKFVKPTVEEIQAYIFENGFSVDANRFYDYYEANGWYAGSRKMKDWQATVRNWERRDKERVNKKYSNTKQVVEPTDDVEWNSFDNPNL